MAYYAFGANMPVLGAVGPGVQTTGGVGPMAQPNFVAAPLPAIARWVVSQLQTAANSRHIGGVNLYVTSRRAAAIGLAAIQVRDPAYFNMVVEKLNPFMAQIDGFQRFINAVVGNYAGATPAYTVIGMWPAFV